MERDRIRFLVAVGALFTMVASGAIAVAAVEIANNHTPDEHVPGLVAAFVFGVITAVAAAVAIVAASRLGETPPPEVEPSQSAGSATPPATGARDRSSR